MLQTCKMNYRVIFHVGRYIETCNKRTVNFLLHIKKTEAGENLRLLLFFDL